MYSLQGFISAEVYHLDLLKSSRRAGYQELIHIEIALDNQRLISALFSLLSGLFNRILQLIHNR